MRVLITSRTRRQRAIAGTMLVLALALSGGLLAACGGDHATAMPAMAGASAEPSGPDYAPAAEPGAIEAAWAARPDYVRHAHPMVEEAYRYALERPDVIQWMPCYCGCAGMEHRSNLDCFFRSRMAGGAAAFEEHASYCDICIETALLAKKRLAEGRTLAEIRAEVDATWGGTGVPGTDTAVPQG
jgi:hypothetical protein